MQASAMASQQKFSILSNELMRRLGNIDHLVEHEEKMEIIEKFVREMKNSGYERKAAREAVISGLRGLKRRREKKRGNGQNFYRTSKETLPERMRRKLMESTTWYREGNTDEIGEEREFTEEVWEGNTGGGMKRGKRKSGIKGGKVTKPKGRGNNNSAKAVMFIPFTKGSHLAKRMRETEIVMEQMSGYKLKIVERGGIKLENILVKKNPWDGECCERKSCLLCDTKRRADKPKMKSCTKRNLVYKTWCQTCLSRELTHVGEDGHVRGVPPADTEDQGIGGEGDHVRPMVGGAGGGEVGAGGGEGGNTGMREKADAEDKKPYLYVGET